MTRILYVSAVAERGGQEVVLLNLVKHLDPGSFRPLVVFLEDGPFVKEVEREGVEVHVIESGRIRDVARGRDAIGRIGRLVSSQQIDVVHTLNAKAHIYGGLGARRGMARCVFHLQGVPAPRPTRDGVTSLLAVAVPADSTVACSHYVAAAFKRTWGLRRPVQVIHSGVTFDADEARVGAATVRSEFHIPGDAPLIVMACRLQRWKGVHVFLAAAAQLLRTVPDARFLIVGGSLFGLEHEYRSLLFAQARSLGLGEAVVFTGFRPDAHRFLAAADVVVHGSIEPDPFPTVIIESMMLGRAVVASDTGGPREMIDHGIDGFLVPPGDAQPLSDGVMTLIRNSPLRHEIGSAAARRAVAYLHASRMAREFEGIYHALVRDGDGARN